jgi:hypothetical protein
MHKRLKDKPGITKGGQHAVVCDANKRLIYDYTPRHSFFKRPPGFGHEGPAEVHRLLTQMKPMIGEGKFYDERLHFTLDNHFSGDNVVAFIGEQGHGATMTTRRNRLNQDVPNKTRSIRCCGHGSYGLEHGSGGIIQQCMAWRWQCQWPMNSTKCVLMEMAIPRGKWINQ